MCFHIKKYLSFLICSTLFLTCGCSQNSNKSKENSSSAPTNSDKIIRIACVGDSLTEGIGATGWQNDDYTYSYPQQLNHILGTDYKVGNFGKGGSYVYYYEDRTESLWYPNTVQYTLSNQFDADIVIILLGTNDARVMNNLADSNAFKAEFTKIVEHYLDLDSKPKVYIASSVTLSRYDKNKEEQLKKYILPMQREVAWETGCEYIDLYSGLYEYFISGEGFASDNLHPNNDGYLKIAEYISQFLK